MKTIILNSTNIVPNSGNSNFIYNFPAGGTQFKNDEIALSNISMYYSWFNINQALYNNNVFNYIWLGTTYVVTIPDGNYQIKELNDYLQWVMIQNGHYLVDGGGNYVYYLELILNVSRYAVEFIASPIPTALPSGWSNPAGLVFPATATTPQIQILSTNNFYKIIGFNAGTYPTPTQSTIYSKLSDTAPQVSPINSIIMECNLINNNLALPSKLLYSFTIQNVAFGDVLNISVPEFSWNDIADGFYDRIQIELKDQNLNSIQINDSQIVILLCIKKKSEIAIK